MTVPKRCLGLAGRRCPNLIRSGSRCRACRALLYDNPSYRARAAAIRANAQRCAICGEGPGPNDPWQADHERPGDPNSPLRAVHRKCNLQRRGHAQRNFRK